MLCTRPYKKERSAYWKVPQEQYIQIETFFIEFNRENRCQWYVAACTGWFMLPNYQMTWSEKRNQMKVELFLFSLVSRRRESAQVAAWNRGWYCWKLYIRLPVSSSRVSRCKTRNLKKAMWGRRAKDQIHQDRETHVLQHILILSSASKEYKTKASWTFFRRFNGGSGEFIVARWYRSVWTCSSLWNRIREKDMMSHYDEILDRVQQSIYYSHSPSIPDSIIQKTKVLSNTMSPTNRFISAVEHTLN